MHAGDLSQCPTDITSLMPVQPVNFLSHSQILQNIQILFPQRLLQFLILFSIPCFPASTPSACPLPHR